MYGVLRRVLHIIIFTSLGSALNLNADSIFYNPLDTKPASEYIPFLQGFKQFSAYADNFIFLEKQKKPLQTPQKSYEKAQQTTTDSDTPSTSTPAIRQANKPKVLLIMDDISQASQIKNLQTIKLNITPSIFPKTKINPKTPNIAQNLAKEQKTYMVHLPLEALNFEQKDLKPIKTGSSKKIIETRLMQIKKTFPNLLYINNHTGSKFTQSKKDMQNLLSVMDELGFKFIDSITTSSPVIEQIAKEQKRLIMQRDIFLDNDASVSETIAQLKKLIQKAQNKGYAIAICHPHTSTFQALSQMRDELDNALELVSPQDLETYLLSQSITQYTRHKFYEASR